MQEAKEIQRLFDETDMQKAFDKELNIIKNDFYYQQIKLDNQAQESYMRFDIFYKPLEMLSGDSYSIRKTKESKIFCFMLDAMGKGLSAALTAITSTTIINYFFDEMQKEDNFDLKKLIERYISYIKSNLLDEEMVAIGFYEYDTHEEILSYAMFGMPSVLAYSLDKGLQKIPSNNPPIMSFSDDFIVNSSWIGEYSKFLAHTDGLSESDMFSGGIYKNQMEDDFADSSCVADFVLKTKEAIGKGNDDIAFFYIEKVGYGDDFQKLTIQSTQDAVQDAIKNIKEYLKPFGVSVKCMSEIILSLSELLLNALEHGSYGLTSQQKSALIEQDIFDDEMIRFEQIHLDKPIEIKYGIVSGDKTMMLEVIITDCGKGFDTTALKKLVTNAEAFNGRGFVIVKKLLDRFYFNEKGNSITIQKFLSFG
ncbi:MAG: SpoIIE family protein phosphatase [Sulfurospirillaceae bacterium]|nr:SpoIIE family protein phosphatase [Sulfurospirillaceae bacterium]